MPDHGVRMVTQLHRRARLALRPARLPARLLGSDLGAGFASPSDDGGFGEFFEFCPALAVRSAT
jgi:hypothetical protein